MADRWDEPMRHEPIETNRRGSIGQRHRAPQRDKRRDKECVRGQLAAEKVARDVAHRRIAIARGEAQAFEDGAHQVREAHAELEAGEHGARRGLHHRAALARLRDIGVEQGARRLGREDALVEALEEELGERSVGFRIDDEDLEDLKTVRDAVDYVFGRVSGTN